MKIKKRTISSNQKISLFPFIEEQTVPEQSKKAKQINESNFKYIERAIFLSQNYYLCQVVKMQINSKVQDFDTVSDSKQVTSTPKSAPNNLKRPKIDKRLSLMQPRDTLKLWRQSSSSMNREKSPSYRIPNAPRFSATHQQEMKNSQFLTLQLRRQIGNKNSITFPHSKRPEHFIKADKIHTPSPATYKCSRFLQETHSAMLPRQISLNNPQTPVTASQKGISIPNFNSHHKSYVDHSKHRPYQPQNTQEHPAPGYYNHSFINKRKKQSYSFRVTLKKFNQTITVNPGPGAYTPYKSERPTSINMKGTIPNSRRTYLTKFQDTPSPQKYNIARFLEQYT